MRQHPSRHDSHHGPSTTSGTTGISPQRILRASIEEYVRLTTTAAADAPSVPPAKPAQDSRSGYHAVRVNGNIHVSRDDVEIGIVPVDEADTRPATEILDDAIWQAAKEDASWLTAELKRQRALLDDDTRAWWDDTLDSNGVYDLLVDATLAHFTIATNESSATPDPQAEVPEQLQLVARDTVNDFRVDIAESVYCHAIAWAKLAIRRQYPDDELARIEQDDLDTIFASEWRSGKHVGDAIQYTLSVWGADLAKLMSEQPEVTATIGRVAHDKLDEASKSLSTQTFAPSMSFSAAAITFLNDPHTQAVIRSMWDIPNWQRSSQQTPQYRHDGVRVYVPSEPLHNGLTHDAAWQRVLELDDNTASTFLICIGKWFADTGGENPHLPKSRIHVADVLGFRGIKKHVHGGYRPEQKEEARRHILALNHIWVQSDEEIFEARGRKKRVRVNSRLLEVSMESQPGPDGAFEPYAFRVAPGDWAKSYLGPHNRLTAQLLQPVMAYDPYKQRMAMRLGIYLASQWRIRASSQNYTQPWRVRTMLDGACLDLPQRNQQRFRDQFENALDQLQDDGVIAGWEYERDSDLPLRRWFPLWLDWTVRITPPAAILEHYSQIASARTRAITRAKRAGSAAQKRRSDLGEA